MILHFHDIAFLYHNYNYIIIPYIKKKNKKKKKKKKKKNYYARIIIYRRILNILHNYNIYNNILYNYNTSIMTLL